MQQVQTAKERFCPHAPFRKKERARLIPYAGSDRYVRQMTELARLIHRALSAVVFGLMASGIARLF